ncbi:MAG: FAD-dependent oxidoreductase [Acidobacteriaceae bacterium]|nr:FAD-dependent oxidoreductase [Acidobacteriaceae bacterium]
MSRRQFSASIAAASLGGGADFARGQSPAKYAVVGSGVFGAWIAYRLQEAGQRVTLVDEYGPANARASSGGESRIIRCSYGPDEVYTRMAKRSLTLWSEFFAKAGRNLLERIGVLWMAKSGNPYVEQSRQTLRKLQIPFRDLSDADLSREYPQIHVPAGTVAILEPESGALLARQAVQAVVGSFVQNGGEYVQAAIRSPQGGGRLREIVTANGDSIGADGFIFACGPWLGKVFPELLGERIFVTRQEVMFFGVPPGDPRFAPPRMPVWIDFSDDRGMYGFPDLESRGFKIAFDRHGPALDPDTANRIVSTDKIAEARAYAAERFPALAGAPIVDSRVCQYENTSNGDFLIDRHPEFENVWIVGGGSGHGFKHGPAVGEYTVARIIGAPDPPAEPRFSLGRKSTEQHRAVF